MEYAPTYTGTKVTQLAYTYTYNSPGDIDNGMPTEVIDETAGSGKFVTQLISYTASGGGKGQVSQISETRDADTSANNSVDYTYTASGERATAIYTTPNGSRGWGYEGYRSVGSPESGGRAFTELWPLVYSGGNWETHGDDPMFYHYDTSGRLMASSFAQTKKTTGWTDDGWPEGDPQYYIAQHRAVQVNEYDPAGRALTVENWWNDDAYRAGYFGGDTYAGPVYQYQTPIGDGKVSYVYDADTGLRTSQSFHNPNGSGGWAAAYKTETYTYDSSLDYLTGVNYDNGGTNETRTWGYDAAGNRNADSAYSTGTWAYDYLNRMTSSPKLFATGSLTSWTYTNDILGNRTTRNQYSILGNPIQLMEWDKLGRMTRMASGTNSSSNGDTYTYRADGQRLSKVGGPYVYGLIISPGGQAYYDIHTGTATPVTRYYYDGTMGMEDSTTSGSTTTINRYGLGARGIDRIEYYDGSSTTYGYPLYDGHGNMRATLYKSGTSYGTQNWKTYDVWGSVRTDGGGTPNPKQGYVANLGHVADDETSLVYMRSRYYEPGTGRFVSQDSARDGHNWFVYCNNEPLNNVDPDGKFVWAAFGVCFLIGFIAGFVSTLVYQWQSGNGINWWQVFGAGLFTGLVSGLTAGWGAELAPAAGAAAVTSSEHLGAALLAYATGTSGVSLGIQALSTAAASGVLGFLLAKWDQLGKVLAGALGRTLQTMMVLDSMQYD